MVAQTDDGERDDDEIKPWQSIGEATAVVEEDDEVTSSSSLELYMWRCFAGAHTPYLFQ